MLVIPNIIDDSVPLGKDDTENVEIEKYGDPIVPEYEIPYHADIMKFNVFRQRSFWKNKWKWILLFGRRCCKTSF